MPNARKQEILEVVGKQFGTVSKLAGGNSLFAVGRDAARIYLRYSKVHEGGRTFFGLREVDLRRLEGHNSYICFVLDDNSPPVVLPFADFEEVFRLARPAADGQYKVQLTSRDGQLELYVARQGRFNVEGYVGFDALARTLRAHELRNMHRSFSHSQVQTLLAGIGHCKGYDVFVPASDAGGLEWTLTPRFELRRELPTGLKDLVPMVSDIDVVWLAGGRNSIQGLFEVEHTTTIYSGLLRFNDVLLADPRVSRFCIVSDESRRSVFSRQAFRPTFRKSGLSELVSFLEYSNVFDWHSRLAKGV